MSRSTTVPPAPGTATTPAARLARDLAPRLRGTLLLPGEPGYAASLPGHNLAVVHAPALVVRAADADDVAGTVRAAARHGLSVAVRSTGHGLATAGPDDVLLDVSQLSCVAVDPEARTATVGPGARWQQVLDAGAPHGLGGLCGSSPGVGVVGYTLGGGLGPLARAFGLAADHVRSLDVVTPTGERVTVTADRRSDLFWALRGGGGAFGVVTSMTFDLFALSTVRGGAIVYDAADAPAVLRHWRTWTATLPEAASTSVARLNLPPAPSVPEPLRGRAVLAVRFAHAGDPAEADVLLAALRAAPARPIVDTVADLPYARLGAIHSDPQDPLPTVERGGALDELTDETIDAFCGAVSPQTPVVTAEIRLLGGAVARPAAVPSAVAGRDAEFSVLVVGLVGPGMPPGGPLAVRSVLGALAPWSSGGAMLNFAGPRDETSASLVRTAHGEPQYQRLVALRRANDPQGVLSASARWEVAADAV